MADSSSIKEWVRGQTAFVTGGTGFLGSSLIYKLLQNDVCKVFTIIRPRKGKTVQERLNTLLEHRTFRSIREKDPELLKRVVAVSGDGTIEGLGLSEEDRKMVQNEVTAVYHVAASIRFDDPLKKAVRTNLRYTRDVVELAKGMKKLQVFTYTSTAYSNADVPIIEEKIYDAKIDWKKMIDLVETCDDEVINALSYKILGASPNTYIFTKHLAESCVNDAAKLIPAVVVRPPVVAPPIKEPNPSQVDNVSSPLSINFTIGVGLVHAYYGGYDTPKDYVASDCVTNITIAAAWDTALKAKRDGTTSPVPVFNMASEPFSPKLFYEYGTIIQSELPLAYLWAMACVFTTNYYVYHVCHILFQVIPAFFFDIILKLMGIKLSFLSINLRMFHVFMSLFPITCTEFKFKLENFYKLLAKVPHDEKEIFFYEQILPDIYNYGKLAGLDTMKLLGMPAEQKQWDHDRKYIFEMLHSTLKFFILYWIVKNFPTDWIVQSPFIPTFQPLKDAFLNF